MECSSGRVNKRCNESHNRAFTKNMKTPILLIFLLSTGIFGQTDSTQADSTILPGLRPARPMLPLSTFDPKDITINLYHQHRQKSPSTFNFNYKIPDDPFKIDYREGSYYIPESVHREIELGKGRDPGTIPIPYMQAALLAYQVLDKFIITPLTEQEKNNLDHLLQAETRLPILQALWTKGSRSLAELYSLKQVRAKHSVLELKRELAAMIEADLLSVSGVNDDIKYKAWLSRRQMLELLTRYLADEQYSETPQYNKALALHRALFELEQRKTTNSTDR